MNHLVIIGSASCASEDLASLDRFRVNTPGPGSAHGELVEPWDFMLIGLDAVDKFPGEVKYFVTYHVEDIPESINRRKALGGNCDFKIISHETKPGVDIVHPHEAPSGSSALMGVLAGIKLGYQRMILAGCPLTGKNPKGGSYDNFQKGWQAHLDQYAGKVRSMSGWTKEFLGSPTEEWLSNGNADH